ncbi:MAG: nuclear transport factor 2 family protein [Pseudomonadota bacterium]
MSKQTDMVATYFEKSDARDPSLVALFTDDVELYFPKFGVGKGMTAFMELGGGFAKTVASIAHRRDEFLVIEQGDHVVVEGTTFGKGHNGKEWSGGETSGGRFCSVFHFRETADGPKICRMHIYLDPDYTGDNTSGFLWGEDRPNW